MLRLPLTGHSMLRPSDLCLDQLWKQVFHINKCYTQEHCNNQSNVSVQTFDVEVQKMAFPFSPTVETFGITLVLSTVFKAQGIE